MRFATHILDAKLFRLLRVRWTGQLTDGIFQSALASFVLFSPERQASAVNAAVAFAVVLLPYSIVGPFVGTILDRFSRQRATLLALFRGVVDACDADPYLMRAAKYHGDKAETCKEYSGTDQLGF